jgi:hypothetical protein
MPANQSTSKGTGRGQLVGQRCVRCAGLIESILEGEFCPGCTNPVHLDCKRPGGNLELCPECGGNPLQSLPLRPDAVSQKQPPRTETPRDDVPAASSEERMMEVEPVEEVPAKEETMSRPPAIYNLRAFSIDAAHELFSDARQQLRSSVLSGPFHK